MKFDRRKFIKRIIVSAAALEAFFLIKGGISKTHLEKKEKELVSAGKADSFDKNKIYPFLTGQFFLKRFDDGGFMAMSIKCTHLGCIVNIDKENEGFACPCHASQFNKYGEVIESPATRPLDIFPITIKNGELLIDISKPVRRKSFEKSQLTYV